MRKSFLQSLTRIAMNFAQLLGPVVGGAIYQAGGFYLPFLTMGTLQVKSRTGIYVQVLRKIYKDSLLSRYIRLNKK